MDSEAIVKNFLLTFGLKAVRFDKKSMNSGKTPDFKILQHDVLIFYCEVKNTKEDEWLSGLLEHAEPDELAGGLRNDPVFNRLTKHIHKARKQFVAVNQTEELPNVLSFFNEDEQSGFLDLLAVATGNAYTESGSTLPIYKIFSEGRVKNDLQEIHLVIWLDTNKPHRFLFNTINDKHLMYLCSLFGFNHDNLKLVHS